MKMPNFLRHLMTSPAYMDKNSKVYAMAEKYLNLLYPGVTQTDATGRMTEPEYDMTLKQFNEAQAELDGALEEAIQEAKDEYMDETGKELSDDVIEGNIELEETIDVRVLMPLGTIEKKHLEVYTLDLPEDGDNPDTPSKNKHIWRWHSEDEGNTCDECASRDGEIYENKDDIPEIPVHPNCRCWLTEEEIDPSGRTISVKPYRPKVPEIKNVAGKDTKEMKMSERGLEWLKKLEGSVKIDGKHVAYDDATSKPIPTGAPLPPGATIGYGHLIKPGEDFSNGLTEKQATELFQRDLQSTYDTIAKQIDASVLASISQNQYDALVAFVFNIGPGSAAPENANRGLYQSTVRKYINDKDYRSNIYPTQEAAWKAFRNHGTLDSRRDAEWRLFQHQDYSGYR